jgi:hypothetical protein
MCWQQLLTGTGAWWLALVAGGLLLAVALLVLARLRRIQSRPMKACVVLSVFAHVLLLTTAYLMRLPHGPGLSLGDSPVVHFVMDDSEPELPARSTPTPLSAPALLRIEPVADKPTELPEAHSADLPPAPSKDGQQDPGRPDDPEPPTGASETIEAEDDQPAVEPVVADPPTRQVAVDPPLAVDAAEPPSALAALPSTENRPEADKPAEHTDPVGQTLAARTAPQLPSPPQSAVRVAIPERYRLRVAERRDEILRKNGGSAFTEAAVSAALAWLAANQDPTGAWRAAEFGAGQGGVIDGQHRGATGLHADTGLTGLALLAFLGAGDTHQSGTHSKVVQRGLEYLIAQQDEYGCLGGQADSYARMYCHGMATLSLIEALGMTADKRLEPFVQRAVNYTLASQHPTTGGWRYLPGDQGDTSQFGWQVMVVRGAVDAGLKVPEVTQTRMWRFLGLVSSGRFGGLASYRPGGAPTPAMTAEALVCRVFLDRVNDAAEEEAAVMILDARPGTGPRNLYFWYYGTLALRLTDSPHWSCWNEALQRELLPTQRRGGPLAGSWDTNTVWGKCGGRVYTTAMAALCLEAYYRYPAAGVPNVAWRAR